MEVTPELVGVILAALFSGGGIAGLVMAFSTSKTASAQATETLSGVWLENIDRLTSDLDKLRARVATLEKDLSASKERERILITLLHENRIDLPPELDT